MSYADDMNATPLNKLPPPVVQSRQDAGPSAPPNYKDLLTNVDVNARGAPPSRAQQQMMMMQQQQQQEEDVPDDEYYPQQQPQQPQHMMYGPPPQGMYPGYNTYNNYDLPQKHEPSHRSSSKKKSALKDKKGGGNGGGVMGFLKANKNVLIVAIVAFLAMRFVAPRLRNFPMMLSPMGGLSAPGMAVLALLIGASTKVADYV